jgi:hypothetical protein
MQAVDWTDHNLSQAMLRSAERCACLFLVQSLLSYLSLLIATELAQICALAYVTVTKIGVTVSKLVTSRACGLHSSRSGVTTAKDKQTR